MSKPMLVTKYNDGKYAGTVMLSSALRTQRGYYAEVSREDADKLQYIKPGERLEFKTKSGGAVAFVGVQP